MMLRVFIAVAFVLVGSIDDALASGAF